VRDGGQSYGTFPLAVLTSLKMKVLWNNELFGFIPSAYGSHNWNEEEKSPFEVSLSYR